MGQFDDFIQPFAGHESKRATGKLQGIDILAHRFQNIFEISSTHRRVVGASNFGKSLRTRLALTLVHTDERKCAIVHETSPGGVRCLPGRCTRPKSSVNSESRIWSMFAIASTIPLRRTRSAHGSASRLNFSSTASHGK